MNNAQVLRKIHLYGKLKDHCDNLDYVEMVGDNLRMIASGLISRFGIGVKKFIRENSLHVFLGETDLGETPNNRDLSEKEVDFNLGYVEDVHILPVVEGSGKAAQIIVGIILVVVGVTFY